jgi:hypothetical protein
MARGHFDKNGQTKERLVIKRVKSMKKFYDKVMLISRYPLGAGKNWIEKNEKEILKWDYFEQKRCITVVGRFLKLPLID